MSEKTKTINLTPFHCGAVYEDGGFVWTFHANTGGGNVVHVKLHLGFWWMPFLARDLWAMVKARRDSIDKAETALKGTQP